MLHPKWPTLSVISKYGTLSPSLLPMWFLLFQSPSTHTHTPKQTNSTCLLIPHPKSYWGILIEQKYLVMTVFLGSTTSGRKERSRVGWISENRWPVVMSARDMGKKKCKTVPVLFFPLNREHVHKSSVWVGQMGWLEKKVASSFLRRGKPVCSVSLESRVWSLLCF